MKLSDYEQMFPHTEAYGLIWSTPNQACAWRVDTLMTKEPDTVAWIETMGDNDVLYDVGANMGQYSMLAAKRGVKVHAFEPESQNFALLCRNVAVNKLVKLITPWPLALSDVPGPNRFFVTQLAAGNSCNAFGESIDFKGEVKNFPFTQGSFGMRLDTFAMEFGWPTHIKIDVDGFEHKVLNGAKCALAVVKSVLVETNTNLKEHQDIAAFMAEFGLKPDLETAEKARRTEGAFKGVGNVIYYRNKV